MHVWNDKNSTTIDYIFTWNEAPLDKYVVFLVLQLIVFPLVGDSNPTILLDPLGEYGDGKGYSQNYARDEK